MQVTSKTLESVTDLIIEPNRTLTLTLTLTLILTLD